VAGARHASKVFGSGVAILASMDENPYKSPVDRVTAAPPEDSHFLRVLLGMTLALLGLQFCRNAAAIAIALLLGQRAPTADTMFGLLINLLIGTAPVLYGLHLAMRRGRLVC
jgi:hypothetical protein